MDVDPRADEAQAGHAVHALDPTVIEYVPAGHKTHVFTLLPPDVAEYAPAGQFTHAADEVAPVAFEYVPATQFTQTLDPAAEYVPAGHNTHTTEELAPDVPEYAPAGQLVQPLAAFTFEYLPVEQLMHTLAPSSEYVPAAQVIHTLALLAAGTFEYVPAVQSVHNELPMIFLNLPATQVVQTPPSGPLYPVLHLHVEINFDVFENGDCELAGHAWHFCSISVMYNSGIFQYDGLQSYGLSALYVGYL